MTNNNHFDRIQKMFGSFSNGYDIGLAFSGLSETSRIRKESIEGLTIGNGETVFDICCGTGMNFKYLENWIGKDGKIIGVDLTQQMLEVAKKRNKKQGWGNIDLVNENIISFDTDLLGDNAICTAAMGMIPEYVEAINIVIKHLKPNGKFAIVDVKESDHFPFKMFNIPIRAFAKTANFDIRNRKIIEYIRTKYEVVSYKEYFGGYFYSIIFKEHRIDIK